MGPVLFGRLVYISPEQEGDDLGAVTILAGGEAVGGDAIGDILLHGPQDGRGVPPIVGDILEGIRAALHSGLAEGPVQEGHDSSPVAGQAGAEVALVGAGGDAIFHGPQHGLLVEAALLHIHKGILGDGRLRTPGGPPQEGHHLGTQTLALGVEAEGIGAVGDLLVDGPGHGDIVEAALLHIDKAVGQGVDGAFVTEQLTAVCTGLGVNTVVLGGGLLNHLTDDIDVVSGQDFIHLYAAGGAGVVSKALGGAGIGDEDLGLPGVGIGISGEDLDLGGTAGAGHQLFTLRNTGCRGRDMTVEGTVITIAEVLSLIDLKIVVLLNLLLAVQLSGDTDADEVVTSLQGHGEDEVLLKVALVAGADVDRLGQHATIGIEQGDLHRVELRGVHRIISGNGGQSDHRLLLQSQAEQVRITVQLCPTAVGLSQLDGHGRGEGAVGFLFFHIIFRIGIGAHIRRQTHHHNQGQQHT